MSGIRTYEIGSAQQDAPERARRALAAVIDPELGLDIVQLGLIYDIRQRGDRLEVDMTLTTPGCPVSEQLPEEARQAIERAVPELSVDLQIVWDPPWNPDMLTDQAMELLGFRRR